jgi:peptidyl-dipeptidase A
VLAKSRNYDELTEAWAGWHTISPPMRKDYERFVELANEGARELGYQDLGAMWRSNYDMPPDAFAQESERLWSQVKPLYDELHCYTRAQLAKKYGEERVPAGKPIPAQLLGNLWAQQWGKIYDLIEPYKGVANLNVDAALKRQGYDARRMTESAETFYKSLGFPALPQTFWERSMLTRPRDREVVCHASAWHMDLASDVRIKQCIRPAEEDLVTIYHELGHVYYFLSYRDQPFLFQDGANDGFHEAIGDTVVLSMTPSYLSTIKLVGNIKPSPEALINQQMKLALDRIAFLPFGELVDQWRWKVFSGEVTPANYNAAWWRLREQYQGVAPPVPRSEEDFDPGAKYHIPGNTPYARYFIAYVLQFQFHRALCEAAGFKGPLHECSVFGSQAAGQRFREMLALGQSQPWQDTLEKLTGTREMDASAITEYFTPLTTWLRDRNQGQQCGW